MIKFMRKHNKKLLAIFASGLLVVWLGSTALQEMFRPDPGNRAAGRAFGQEFMQKDLGHAHTCTEVLGSVEIMWDRPWGGGGYNLPIKPLDLLTWFLLDQEARRKGVEVPAREVERFVKASPRRARMMEAIRDRRGISIETIMGWIGDFIRISRVGQMAASSVKVSIPEVEHFVRDTREKVQVRMAILRASEFADPNTKPTDAELEKHFREHRDKLPGESAHGFGYKWPDRIRVEYIVADVEKLEAMMKISRDEARDYWSANRKNYTKEVPLATAPASGPATTQSTSTPSSKPTTTAASHPTTSTRPATKTVIMSFAEAYDQAVADLKRQRAPALADKLIRLALERLHEPWYEVVPDKETGYKSAPAGVDAPDYLDKIAEDVCRRNDLPAAALRVVKPGRWLTRTDVDGLEAIGKAVDESQRSEEGAPITFSDLAFRVQNIYVPPKRSSVKGLSLFEVSNTMLRDTKDGLPHNYYLFRVVAAEPTHEPGTVDEIKDTLIRDCVQLAGYQTAGRAARKLLAASGPKGIDAAVKADPDLAKRLGDKGVVEPEPFARRRSLVQYAIQFGLPLTPLWPIEELGVTEERKIGLFPVPMTMVAQRYEDETRKFIDACFGLAGGPDAASKPARSVGLVEMPNRMQWVVIEFVKLERVKLSDYASLRRQALELLQTYRTIDFLRRWYDADQVKLRTGFAPVTDEKEE